MEAIQSELTLALGNLNRAKQFATNNGDGVLHHKLNTAIALIQSALYTIKLDDKNTDQLFLYEESSA